MREDIYRVEIPLKGNPLKALFSYFIKGIEKNIIIDTGFNSEACKEHLLGAIKELDIDISKTIVILTHLHSDHCGLAYMLESMGADIYASKIDGDIINDMCTEEYWDKFKEYEKAFGLDVDSTSFIQHPGYKYRPENKCNIKYLKEGDKITCGNYCFEVVETPGHTPGLIGLYDSDNKVYYSGDHILGKITPNIAYWGEGRNDLNVYLKSLDKIKEYDINEVYTPHRYIVTDIKTRIGELCKHHKDRLEEIMDVVGHEKITPRDVASKMSWSLTCKEWSDFPDPQKWFATSEAMSHLEYLYYDGRLNKDIHNETFYYSKLIK